MGEQSAGILLYRFREKELQVFLVHPGGPFWARRDEGAWSIPKGLMEAGENPLDAARREFREETGFEVEGGCLELGELKQPSRKLVHAWASEQDIDPSRLKSNTFTLEWPKASGQMREYPEVDRGGWFGLEEALKKILKGQAEFLDRLLERLQSSADSR
jgi:predicted NUDIX family NTP pyrophosphohydrolase